MLPKKNVNENVEVFFYVRTNLSDYCVICLSRDT